MRRFLLIFTLLSVPGWSQAAAPQPGQPPIVVKVEMPPTNPWVHTAELGISGLIGFLSALITVWLTTRNNAATQDANRQHELELLIRRQSFELKRDLLLRLTAGLVQTRTALEELESALSSLDSTRNEGGDETLAAEQYDKSMSQYYSKQTDVDQFTATASLAVSDHLWKSAQAISASSADAYRRIFSRSGTFHTALEQIDKDVAAFTQDARTELGIIVQ